LGLLVFRPIVYKPLWDTFVGRFELYKNLSFLSSLEVLLRTTNPYLWNLRFRVADLPHLSWNLLQVAWIPPVPKTPKSTSSIFSPFVLGFIPIFVLDEFHPKSEMILHHFVHWTANFRELSFLEVNSPLPYFACKWRHHHSSLGFGWLRSPLWVVCCFHSSSSMLSIFIVSSFILLFKCCYCRVCLSLNPTLFFLSWAWEMNLHI